MGIALAWVFGAWRHIMYHANESFEYSVLTRVVMLLIIALSYISPMVHSIRPNMFFYIGFVWIGIIVCEETKSWF